MRRVRRGGRRMWSNQRRTHVELRAAVSAESARRLASELESELARLSGVHWAKVHHQLRRVVVSHDATIRPSRSIFRQVARFERRRLPEDVEFDVDQPERYPGDAEPLARTMLELGTDVWALGMATALRWTGRKAHKREIDLAAVLSLIQNVPAIRKPIERVIGIPATELLIDLASALNRVLVVSEVGSVAETLSRGLRLRELYMRRRLWPEWERTLCADPHRFPAMENDLGRRPEPPPRGHVSDYVDKATAASLGAFGLGFAASRSLEGAASAIFAGLPRPARVGRDAFAAHLGARLAAAKILVLEPHALRKLERIDCVVADERLIGRGPRAAPEIPQAVRAGELELKTTSPDDAFATVRRQQRRGRGVCFVGLGLNDAHAAADFAIDIASHGETFAWDAHVLCRAPESAPGLILAIAAARRCSKQSVALSELDALIGLGLCSTGLEQRTTERIMSIASAMSIMAMGNAVRLAHEVPIEAGAPPRDPTPWHELSIGEVIDRLGTSEVGLSTASAASRRRPTPRPPSTAARLARAVADELSNPMTPLLAAGAGLSAFIGSATDAALIASVMVADAVFGGVERVQAELAISRLAADEKPPVDVRRDGRVQPIGRDVLVVGDVVELQSGQVVPADGRLIEAQGLEVDESSLTGESLPVAKSTAAVSADAVAERRSMLYDGTVIAAGRAVFAVTAVGDATEARRAMALGAGRADTTGVERRLETITRLSGPVAGAAGAALAGAALLRRRPVKEVLNAGVSLAVAAVPEGLPLLATISQLAAARRLSRRGALVRNPRAVEALGRVDVLCADKTATLTQGRLRLSRVSDGTESVAIDAMGDRHRRVLAAAVRASPAKDNGSPLPHLTDRALVEGAQQAGIDPGLGVDGLARERELPFEPGRGFHAGLSRHDRGRLISVKGAPEQVVPRCCARRIDGESSALDEAGRRALLDRADDLARRGFRVLAVAERAAGDTAELDDARVEELVFDGFVLLTDPVRATARSAIDALRRAGIRTVMVTGDHPSTAAAIADALGIGDGEVLTGPELEQLDVAELTERAQNITVFARVTPTQKLRIVQALQRAGRTVAMTGDGANDAPAIRLADVGIALGADSTAAARDAADMIVTDERIETIVSAVLEGRALWTSVRDAIAILVGGNLGEIFFTLASGLAGRGTGLNARQLLLINMVTDTLPALAIASGEPRGVSPEQLMREGGARSLGAHLDRAIAWRAAITAGASSLAYAAARIGGRSGASTVALVSLTGSQLAQTLLANGRSASVVATSLGSMAAVIAAVQTPVVSQFFGCRPLGPIGWAQAATAVGGSVVASLIAKRRLSDHTADSWPRASGRSGRRRRGRPGSPKRRRMANRR